jgi:3-oxoacyl-[acyl-carrier protein] reductase
MSGGRLCERFALVTGGAGGIGAAVCKRLSADGAGVAIADIDLDGAELVAGEISDVGGAASAVHLDVTSRESWEMALAHCRTQSPNLDILVNAAGITRDRSIRKMTDQDWRSVIDVSLYGTWLGCQLAFQEMAVRGGAIVNFASTAMFGAFGQSNYSAAKAGITGLTRTAAIEGGRHGIRVNAVAPGFVDTEMTKNLPDALKAEWIRATALKRSGAPHEIASVVAFLASLDADFVTGQTIVVDGGSGA